MKYCELCGETAVEDGEDICTLCVNATEFRTDSISELDFNERAGDRSYNPDLFDLYWPDEDDESEEDEPDVQDLSQQDL